MSKITCGIEKLKGEEVGDFIKAPDNFELMNKINEIIDCLDNQVNREVRR